MRLLSLANEEVVKMLDDYDKDSKALKRSILKMCWYMRGSLSYDEGMTLTYADREIINDIIKENLDATKESGLPFF